VAVARKLAAPLAAVGAERVRPGFSGVDIIPLTRAGVPGLGLEPDPTHYFDYHHTAADTFDKIDPMDLSLQVAAMTLMAWELANAPETLPRKEPPPAKR
jgi:carboxypeptidase Q